MPSIAQMCELFCIVGWLNNIDKSSFIHSFIVNSSKYSPYIVILHTVNEYAITYIINAVQNKLHNNIIHCYFAHFKWK